MSSVLFRLCILMVALSVCAHARDGAEHEVLVLSPDVVSDDLGVFLQGDDILDVRDFGRPKSRRDLVDYVLMFQALSVGGIDVKDISVVDWGGISYDRLLLRLQNGEGTIFSNTIWREDIGDDHPHLYVSEATIGKGQYYAGVYMHPENPNFKRKIDFSKLTAVSSDQWRPDWSALSKLPLKRLYNTVNWENMFRMVYEQRADFMLIAFPSTEDLSYSAIGMTLKPVNNVKVSLDGSRAWVISKTHPTGDRVKMAIDRGLDILRKGGRIKMAFQTSGVIPRQAENWEIINPESGNLANSK